MKTKKFRLSNVASWTLQWACTQKLVRENIWSGGPIFHGILVRGTNFFMENWSYAENFGPTMDQFSMEFWSGGPIFHGILVRGDQFSMEYWSGRPIFS